MKYLLVLFLVLTAACGCPTNESGVAAAPNKYARERDAACAAVSGCSPEFMASVQVYEAVTLAEVNDACAGTEIKAYACFCERVGCASIVLWNPSQLANHYDSNGLHEYVHAALASAGLEAGHGPLFDEAFAQAQENMK